MRAATAEEIREWAKPTQVTAKYISDRARKASREIGKKEGYLPERTEKLRKTMISRATGVAKKHGVFVEAV